MISCTLACLTATSCFVLIKLNYTKFPFLRQILRCALTGFKGRVVFLVVVVELEFYFSFICSVAHLLPLTSRWRGRPDGGPRGAPSPSRDTPWSWKCHLGGQSGGWMALAGASDPAWTSPGSWTTCGSWCHWRHFAGTHSAWSRQPLASASPNSWHLCFRRNTHKQIKFNQGFIALKIWILSYRSFQKRAWV